MKIKSCEDHVTMEKQTLTRTFVFGAFPPTIGANLVEEALLKGGRYYNDLTAIRRTGRQDYRKLRSSMYPDIQEIEDALELKDAEYKQLQGAIKAFKISSRSRKVDPLMAARAAVLKTERAKLRDRWHTINEQIKTDRDFSKKVEAMNAKTNELEREAREGCGVYWGTYLLVEDAVKRAFKSKIKAVERVDKKTKQIYKDRDPWFHTWKGEGRIGVQLQKETGSTEGGISLGQLTTDTRFQIDLPSRDIYALPRGLRIKASQTKARIRVGSDKHAKPIWAEFPIVMHRPLPEDARIVWAWVSRTKGHLRSPWKYQLGLILKSSELLSGPKLSPKVQLDPPPRHVGTATINFGWRQMTDGSLRVATVNNPAYGKPEEIRLPARLMNRFDYSESLRSIKQKHFNTAKEEMLNWIGENCGKIELPEWLTDIRPYFHLVKSQIKMARLIWHWRKNRFAGDDVIFASMNAWAIKWAHLHEGEECNYKRALNFRKDFYRKTVSRLLQMHADIAMEDFDMREIAKRKAPEFCLIGGDQAKANRVRAAVSELRLWLAAMAPRYHTTVTLVKAQNNTKRCHMCGELVELPQEAFIRKIKITCTNPECKATWDQDVNNTENQHIRLSKGEVAA